MNSTELSDVKPVVISTIVVCNVISNTLLVAVLLKHAQLRVDCTTLFMLSLSVSDLAGAITTGPVVAAVCSRATPTVRHMTHHLPTINMICLSCFGFVSMYSQAWVALSKMVAIVRPLTHEQLLSRTRCCGIIASLWIAGAAVGTATLMFHTTWNVDLCTNRIITTRKTGMSAMVIVYYVVTYFLPEVAFIYATARIFLVVVHVHREVSAQEQSFAGGGHHAGLVTLCAIRSARNILVICFASLALAFPFTVHIVMRFGFKVDAQAMSLFSFVAIWLYICNSFLNSFLYMVLHKSVRLKLGLMFVGVYDFICFH